MTDEELILLKTLLQRNEYEEIDITGAWLAIEELIELREGIRALMGYSL